MRRPVLHTLCSFICGILLSHTLRLDHHYGFLICISCFALYSIVHASRRLRTLRDPVLLLLIVSVSCFYHTVRNSCLPAVEAELLESDKVVLFGRIDGEPEDSYGRLLLRVRADSAKVRGSVHNMNHRFLVRANQIHPVPGIGDEFSFTGEFRGLKGLRNPGGFDSRAHHARSGISHLFVCSEVLPIISESRRNLFHSFKRAISNTRRRISHILQEKIGGDEASLLTALLLGKRSDVRGEVLESFVDSGVIHVLAVSGLHVGILWLALFTVFRTVQIPHKWVLILSSVCLVIYCFLTGERPPVVRATAMFISFSLALLLEREVDILNAVCVAALFILICNPSCVFDTGFQLSFACTASIIRTMSFAKLTTPRLFSTRKNPLARWFVSALFVSAGAQLGSLPLLMYHMNRFSVTPIVANLCVIPLAAADICLGLLVAALGVLGLPLSGIVAQANWLSLRLTLLSVDIFSSLPFSTLRTVTPSLLFIGVWYILLFLLPDLRSSHRARVTAFLTFLVATNCVTWGRALKKTPPAVSVAFLDVGQGDCCFLETGSGETILIDAGPRFGDYDCGESVVAPFLWKSGKRRIDTIVLTHPHNDHLGGMQFLLEHFEVGQVFDAGAPVTSSTYVSFLKTVKEREIRYRIARKGDMMLFGSNHAAVLHPDKKTMEIAASYPHFDVNECSVVILLTCGSVNLLFTGDLEDMMCEALSCVDRVDVIKAPHHGSRAANEEVFESRVEPRIAVFSVGSGNRFGLPSEEILRGYLHLGSAICRTDRDGCVFLTTDGLSLTVRTMREIESIPPMYRFLAGNLGW